MMEKLSSIFKKKGFMKSVLYLLLLFFALMLPACASRDIQLHTATEKEQLSLFDSFDPTFQHFSSTTHNFINSRLVAERLKLAPKEVVFQLAEEFEAHNEGLHKEYNELLLLSLAEICFVYGQNQKNPSEAVSFYLAAAKCSYRYISLFVKFGEINVFDPRAFCMVRIYNASVLQIYNYLQKEDIVHSNSFIITDAFGQINFFKKEQFFDYPLPAEFVSQYIPCGHFRLSNCEQMNYKFGIGVPLIAVIDHKKPTYSPASYPRELSQAVTTLLRFENKSLIRTQNCWFDYFWSSQENCKIELQEYPLEKDFTTPIAYQYRENSFFDRVRYAFNPDALSLFSEGLYLMEPYTPEKIPVVFVHGLLSSPGTWAQMINTLRADPNIRKNYQFIFYTYPSGCPVLYSSLQLREKLDSARICVEHLNDPMALERFDQMVIIGHSMGGLLAKAQISNADTVLLNHLILKYYPNEYTKLSPSGMLELEKTVCFKSSAYIKRAMFLATPHKGSQMAENRLVSWFSHMISYPASFLKSRSRIYDSVFGKDSVNIIKIQSGIGNLNPKDPVLLSLDQLSCSDSIPFHSVIGNENGSFPGGSDGVVPYASAHKQGAESELVVKYGHSVQENPLAIREVRRILILHLKHYFGTQKGKDK